MSRKMPGILRADRGNSDFDARHRVVVSNIYELPFGQGKTSEELGATLNTLLGGWKMSGIAAFQSGQPIFVQLSPSNQNSNTGSTRDRPDTPSLSMQGDRHQGQAGHQ